MSNAPRNTPAMPMTGARVDRLVVADADGADVSDGNGICDVVRVVVRETVRDPEPPAMFSALRSAIKPAADW